MSTPAAQTPTSTKIKRLPLQDVGLNSLVALPYMLTWSEPLHTLLRLAEKEVEATPLPNWFSNSYTINGITATAYEFMYGKQSHLLAYAISELAHILESDSEGAFKSIYTPGAVSCVPADIPSPVDPSSLTALSLDSPEQFAMGLTNYEGLYDLGKSYLPAFVSSLTDPDEASKQFWPTLGNFSFMHNLLILEKVRDDPTVEDAKSRLGDAWSAAGIDALYKEGLLYALDMSILDCVALPEDNASNRYAHATFTLLRQDAQSKALEPIAIWISGKNVDGQPRIYTRKAASPGAWLYALQAVKASIFVYGIWLRHAYLWHVVPGTMQTTLNATLDTGHPIYKMVAPESKYTVAFNELLLLFWGLIAPPTSITKTFQFLQLANEFAKDRGFFDDDPKVALERLGLQEHDFSQAAPWDQYAAVRDLLELWNMTEQYVDVCVDVTYPDDSAVADDASLQSWIAVSSAVDEGNVRGLEPLDGKPALKRFLNSLLYRVIAHGGANLLSQSTLIHLFVPNYLMALQRRDIPEPEADLDTKQLLTYLPNTGTIGIMARFYFTFVLAKPYEPFVPREGAEADLFFPSGLNDPRNRALVAYRNALLQFVNARAILPNQIGHWPLNIEI